ncbi:hypothetical protein CDD81_5481 [Ophiocordyceps australis]|uniref:Autophagy-related protein 9 n=1 Tax=Ophiocordyceps australis TaxID=1399860 RepID=A0A2C5XUA3_9HYPO|nr:hypothetical protein CDD81_5481 [Ophiocordyceps australis]
MAENQGPKAGTRHLGQATRQHQLPSSLQATIDDDDGDVPASLLVEANLATPAGRPLGQEPAHHGGGMYAQQTQQKYRPVEVAGHSAPSMLPSRLSSQPVLGNGRQEALWRWANIANLDSFLRDIYDYYRGGGLLCILCSNALWLLETLFVAVFLTFLTQCIDYAKLPHSKSLGQIVLKQCTRNMSASWSLGIWIYSFFFIWKAVQYFFEIRRLVHIRDFYTHLLQVPEQDMQTVSWQDIVVRIMALRDQNPRTALNMAPNLRRFIGSQSKERLDAHDIANRLMRRDNYLIAMINKDLINLSLPLPFMRHRQLFSKTMEWYLHYTILDMVFNELGQVRQDFLRADQRVVLSRKLRQRLYFAGLLNLLFAPVVLAYVIIVYFFTYYNEYQKDPKLAAARKYTALAEWKFREFNELPHIFYERLHMSYPFATRYMDQFPKRMTEEIARSVAFISGALTAVLALCTLLDSELFLGFEITPDRTVLFYLGIFGGVWAITRGMVSEESNVFNPEWALRQVIEYTHYVPDHWRGRLHSFEVKRDFSDLYKMKVVIFLEEIMGIITTPLLLLLSLPQCSDQIIDFFREFTIHIDGLGYVCSFAIFDFKTGAKQQASDDVRDDYYSTKHGKMAASYYGFLDNYVVNPKTGVSGNIRPRQHFYPPPLFPSLTSPTLAAHLHGSSTGHVQSRTGGQAPMSRQGLALDLGLELAGPPQAARGISSATQAQAQPSPMASILLDPHHQPRSLHRPRQPRGAFRGGGQQRVIKEHQAKEDSLEVLDEGDDNMLLEGSLWETSPGKAYGTELGEINADTDDIEAGVLGLLRQMRPTTTTQSRRGVII